ncbi:MAG: chemotaxis protein CheC [Methanosarcina thermophila]|jgi:chemotaxis protein CheC|uniref:Chemotaxis protein CheC n=3 Tax=Methanosarcina thermophila TaxID=2210 RepID=A0A1I6ZH54_METTE|nr:chemotaxis protein CheC [Methanosarcina thermophila]ALK04869.1 MAG: chemotaxis protein CheC [Methanosarcina sp. 795]AKB13585.1 Chemotaxis protein CheC -- inhibitor of MCP methylation [Methanosarcina thermophila TM-1]AKB15777.1 Chemotaxis protein CheC -- inhibitor of MCP methylation [Methanosarcina thermophila CHTI-55]NLU56747.1 chemotaxis protein CheC [Methanosarcina thermophila]SFT62007.1 chemotaxis protein CheC [Methanosarcina thermophila]
MEEIGNLRNLSEYEYGALKELGNIGIGNSATSLYKLTNSLVQTRVLSAKLDLIENIPKITSISEFPILGSLMHIEKDLAGYILVFFPEKSVKNLALIFLDEEKEIDLINAMNRPLIEKGTDLIDTMSRSLIEEVSHIVAGTYVTALSKFLDLTILVSAPYTVYDMSSSILNSVLTEMSYKTDFSLLLDTEFLIKEKEICGYVLTLFDPASLDRLLKRINEIPH